MTTLATPTTDALGLTVTYGHPHRDTDGWVHTYVYANGRVRIGTVVHDPFRPGHHYGYTYGGSYVGPDRDVDRTRWTRDNVARHIALRAGADLEHHVNGGRTTTDTTRRLAERLGLTGRGAG